MMISCCTLVYTFVNSVKSTVNTIHFMVKVPSTKIHFFFVLTQWKKILKWREAEGPEQQETIVIYPLQLHYAIRNLQEMNLKQKIYPYYE